MTDSELEIKFEELLDEALKLYMEKENEKAEKDLENMKNENIQFSDEHQKTMKEIFKLASKLEKRQAKKALEEHTNNFSKEEQMMMKEIYKLTLKIEKRQTKNRVKRQRIQL